MYLIQQGDCLELMKDIPDKSIDMILCDLPYGTTSCNWDIIIPFEKLWTEYNRIIKDNGNIVLFGSQPFTTLLIHSNFKNYKYSWIWEKQRGIGFQYAKSQPLRATEDICVFTRKTNESIGNDSIFNELREYFVQEKEKAKLKYKDIKNLLNNNMGSHYFTKGIQWSFPTEKDYKLLQTTGYFNVDYKTLKEKYDNLKGQIKTSNIIYYPQMIKLDKPKKYKMASSCNLINSIENKKEYYYVTEKYPTNILKYKKVSKPIHPTQKTS